MSVLVNEVRQLLKRWRRCVRIDSSSSVGCRQQPDDTDKACCRGDVKRGLSKIVCTVHVCAELDERTNDVNATSKRRVHQRGQPKLVYTVIVYAILDESSNSTNPVEIDRVQEFLVWR